MMQELIPNARYGEAPPDLRPRKERLKDRGISLIPGLRKIIICRHGSSDKIIKITPWTCNEKLWTDNNNGRARWERIKSIMERHVPRTEMVPQPVSYHAGMDFRNIVITADDIPIVRLENFTPLEPPLDELEGAVGIELLPDNHPDIPGQSVVKILSDDLESKSELKTKIKELEEKLATMDKSLVPSQKEAVVLECDFCDKTFTTNGLRAMHRAKYHKEELKNG